MHGCGGTDSKLFVYDLFHAYEKYAGNHHLNCELLDDENGHIVAQIKGNGAGKLFSKEIGKHIVQRVPPTENRGRKQTSVVTVAVLPLPPDCDYKPLPESEIEIISQCGHGPGGQHQNKSATSIRAIHNPTGTSVFIVGRSQKANKRDAIKILTTKVNEQYTQEKTDTYNYLRKKIVGNGNRGSKIRTYNFTESRITDHRNGKKIRNMNSIFCKGRFDLLNG